MLATNSSGDSPQSEYTNDVTLTGGNPTPAPPNVVRKLKVTGGSFAKKYAVTWKVPKDASGQPVLYYRLKLKQIGFAKLLKKVRLKNSVEKYTFTRKWLLKHSKRSRGDVRGIQLNYRVTVEAFNTAGGGPLSASRFHLKIA